MNIDLSEHEIRKIIDLLPDPDDDFAEDRTLRCKLETTLMRAEEEARAQRKLAEPKVITSAQAPRGPLDVRML